MTIERARTLPPFPEVASALLLSFALLAALNISFLLVRVAGTYLPKDTIEAALATAFGRGTATTEDYPVNPLVGLDQYTDCVSFELALLGNDGVFAEALAPRLLQDVRASYRCVHLARYLDGVYRPDRAWTYTRFWQGQATLTAAMLQVFSLGYYRTILVMLCYASIGFAGLCVAHARPERLFVLAPLFALAFALSGIAAFGSLVSHAPPFIALWVVVGVMVLRRPRLNWGSVFIFGVVAGAIEAYLDMLMLVPFSAAIFVLFANAAFHDRLRELRPRDVWIFNAAATAAWACGFLGTYVFKIGFTIALLGWEPVMTPLTDQLTLHLGTVNSAVGLHEASGLASRLALLGRNLVKLGGNLWRLGYAEGSLAASAIIAVLALFGWLAASVFFVGAFRRGRGSEALANGAGFIAASSIVMVWFALLPEHTFVHAWFMVRATVVWIAAGWCWAFAEYAEEKAAVPARLRLIGADPPRSNSRVDAWKT